LHISLREKHEREEREREREKRKTRRRAEKILTIEEKKLFHVG
jgi:hypothetical protein